MKDKKKVVQDFDTIDVTTATDEEIIESGIKKNTASDKRNYFLMVFIFIFIIIPPLLRLAFPKPILFEERKIVYLKQNCFVSVNRIDNTWRFDSNYNSFYRDGKLEKVILEYTYQKNIETAIDNPSFPEINELNDIKSNGYEATKFQKDIEGGKIEGVRYTLNFKEYGEDLKKDHVLTKYSYGHPTMVSQMKEIGFMCTPAEIDEKIETVSVNE